MYFELLFWLFVLLGVITVVGHLIWITLAAIGRALFGKPEPIIPVPPSAAPDLHQDAEATHRLLGELNRTGELSDRQYLLFTEAVAKRLRNHQQLDGPQPSAPQEPLPSTAPQPTETPPSPQDQEIVFAEVVQRPPVPVKIDVPLAPIEPATPTAPSVPAQVPPADMSPSPAPVAAVAQEQSVSPMPVESVRQGLGEILSAFMRERNIRWGELVSGILIIGSAVGLVISLRDQLQEHIPYFSPLLFLLITGAIHLAGIYTLRRWKLRDTSRGVLIIGMLLIPLNFFAACTLAEKRELTDPIYWAAMAIGLLSFSVMTAFASQALLRKQWWPLWIGVMGSGLSQLWINRTLTPDTSSIALMSLVAPATLCFAVAVLFSRTKIWNGLRISGQTCFRILLAAGIGLFSFGAVLALVALRSDSLSGSAAATSPLLSIASLLLAWLGWFMFRNVAGRRSAFHSTLGAILAVLGVCGALAALLSATSNATLLAITAAIDFGVLFALSTRRSMHGLIPVAWSCAVVCAIATLGHTNGHYSFDSATNWSAHRDILLSAFTPYCLLGTGIVALLVHGIAFRKQSTDVLRFGMGTGAGLAMVACFAAVGISLVFPSDLLNMHSATWMLVLVFVGIVVGCCRLTNPILPHLMGTWAIITGLHAFFWNPVGKQIALSWTGHEDLRWVAIAHVLALIPAVVLLIRRSLPQRAIGKLANDSYRQLAQSGFIGWSVAGILLTGLASFLAVFMNGFGEVKGAYGTGFAFVAIISSGLIGDVSRKPWASWLIGCVGILFATVLAIQFRTLLGMEVYFDSLNGWEICIALILFSLGWKVFSMVCQARDDHHWLLKPWPRPDMLADGIVMCLIVIGTLVSLASGIRLEMTGEAIDALAGFTLKQLIALLMFGALLLVAQFDKTSFFSSVLQLLWWTCLLIGCAALFESGHATLSATRSLFAISGLVACLCMVWRSAYRPSWVRFRRRMNMHGRSTLKTTDQSRFMTLTADLTIAGVVLCSLVPLSYAMLGKLMHGPNPDSLFGMIPVAVSHLAPIALLMTTLLIFAVDRKRDLLAVRGTCVFLFFVTWLVLILPPSWSSTFVEDWFTRLLQVASIGMSAYGLAWWWFGRKAFIEPTRLLGRPLLELHVLSNVVLAFALPFIAILHQLVNPLSQAAIALSVGSAYGYVSLLSVAVLALVAWPERLGVRGWSLGIIGCGIVGTISCSLQQSLSATSALSALLVGLTLISILVIAYAWRLDRKAGISYLAGLLPATLPVGLATAAALRLYFFSPSWIAVICLMTIAVAVFALAVKWRSAYTAAMASVYGIVAFLMVHWSDALRWYDFAIIEYWQLAVIPILLLGIAWNICLTVFGRASEDDNLDRPIEFTYSVALIGIAVVMFGGFSISIAELFGGRSWQIGTVVLIVFYGFFLVSTLWCRGFPQVASLAYLWLLGSILSIKIGGDRSQLVAIKCICLGATVSVAALLILRVKRLGQLGQQLSIPSRSEIGDNAKTTWPIISFAVSVLIALPTLLLVFRGDALHLAWIGSTLACLGLIPLAHTSDQQATRYWAISACSFVAGILSLSIGRESGVMLLESGEIEIVSRLLVAVGFLTAFLGVIAIRMNGDNRWRGVCRRFGLIAGVTHVVALAGVVALQSLVFVPGEGAGPGWALTLCSVAASLVLVILLVCVAIRRSWDPLDMPERFRQAYVYVAQIVLVLIGVHLFLAMPWIFRFGLAEFWPYIAMGITYIAVTIAELARRQKLTVIATPLFNTAIVLPIVLSAGYWAVESRADPALLMLLGGVYYMLVGAVRKNPLFGVASFLFGNAALWFWFDRFPTLSFQNTPQLWLIPPAVSAIIAAQMNRQRLTASQIALVRYLSVAVIYISSTSEIFLHGLGEQLWPPIILTLLSVGGIFAGMLLRIRAYLYFGVLFLLVSMIAMVSHAHQQLNHVWPWWAFGIGLGTAILVMFGLFEKKKNQITTLARRLQNWDY